MAPSSRRSSPVAELSVVQVLDCIEPLVATSSAAPALPSCSAVQVDSSEPTVRPSSGSSGRRLKDKKDEILSQWNSRKVFESFGTHEQCVGYAESKNLLPYVKMCSHHRVPMKLVSGGHLGLYRCLKTKCKSRAVSRADGTWFANAHMPLPIIFKVMYFYSHGCTYDYIRRECCGTDRDTVLSDRTIADWFSYCREAIVVYELEHQSFGDKIGGVTKNFHIDESKFGKRKYNRGRQIEGHWVIGMIEDKSDDLRLEICPDNERSSEVLVPLIKNHVREGSIIHTDFWRAYDCLPDHGYVHKKVNHSDPEHRFVAPDGVHTQRIENQWRVIKRAYHKDQYKGNFSDWLVEYSWRKKISIYHRRFC